MTNAAAKPFAFDEFGVAPAQPTPSFTAEDIFAAEKNAREAALDAIIARQAQAQTDLLEKLSTQIEQAQKQYGEAVAERQQSLREMSERIVTIFCDGVAADHQIALVLALLDRYLNASPAHAPLNIRLPEKTSEHVLKTLKDELSNRAVSDFIDIVASSEIAQGDCRVEWRGGAMSRDMTTIKNEISAIFTSENDAEGAHSDQQARQP